MRFAAFKRFVIGFLPWLACALASLSCGLVISFDEYKERREVRFTITTTVVGLDGNVKATVLLNNEPVGEADNGVAFQLPVRVVPGASYVIGATAPGHECKEATTETVRTDVSVEVHCLSADPTLTRLSVSLSGVDATLAPTFDPNIVHYRATLPLLKVLAAPTVQILATTKSSTAKLMIGGVEAASGVPMALPFDGKPTGVDVKVIAASGADKTHAVDLEVNSAYVKASNTRAESRFGTSIALSDDTLAIGAPGESSGAIGVNGDQSDTSIVDAGAVYVFTRSAGTWSLQAYLKASNTHAGAHFGTSLALSGDTLVVGAPDEASSATGVDGNQADTSVLGAGAAYVFTRTAGIWSQQAYVKASNTARQASFGASVALAGDTLAVGSPNESSIAKGINGSQTTSSQPTYCGATYVFTRNAGKWSQQAYVKASNTHVGMQFGNSVALSGDTLAVGAIGETSDATGIGGTPTTTIPSAGAVYVFTRTGEVWSQQAYVKASNTRSTAQFGSSVAVMGDTMVVGSPRESSGATGVGGDQADQSAPAAGAVYVFSRTAATWSQQAYVKASNTAASIYFGTSVALAADTFIVGARGENSAATGVNGDQSDASQLLAGAAYVFGRKDGLWAQRAYVKPTNTRSNARFGFSTALSQDTLAVGAYLETSKALLVGGDQSDTSTPGAGAVYVY